MNCLLVEEGHGLHRFPRLRPLAGLRCWGWCEARGRSGGHGAQGARGGTPGLILEGDFAPEAPNHLRQRRRHSCCCRRAPECASTGSIPVAGTNQGVWPGRAHGGEVRGYGRPWIDTNSGFLRYVRAATDAPAWIANRPPEARRAAGRALPAGHLRRRNGGRALGGRARLGTQPPPARARTEGARSPGSASACSFVSSRSTRTGAR